MFRCGLLITQFTLTENSTVGEGSSNATLGVGGGGLGGFTGRVGAGGWGTASVTGPGAVVPEEAVALAAWWRAARL